MEQNHSEELIISQPDDKLP